METDIEQVKRLRARIDQAQATRNKLNQDIENMIDELCRKLRDMPLADRIQADGQGVKVT
jgi:cell division protein FtsB